VPELEPDESSRSVLEGKLPAPLKAEISVPVTHKRKSKKKKKQEGLRLSAVSADEDVTDTATMPKLEPDESSRPVLEGKLSAPLEAEISVPVTHKSKPKSEEGLRLLADDETDTQADTATVLSSSAGSKAKAGLMGAVQMKQDDFHSSLAPGLPRTAPMRKESCCQHRASSDTANAEKPLRNIQEDDTDAGQVDVSEWTPSKRVQRAAKATLARKHKELSSSLFIAQLKSLRDSDQTSLLSMSVQAPYDFLVSTHRATCLLNLTSKAVELQEHKNSWVLLEVAAVKSNNLNTAAGLREHSRWQSWKHHVPPCEAWQQQQQLTPEGAFSIAVFIGDTSCERVNASLAKSACMDFELNSISHTQILHVCRTRPGYCSYSSAEPKLSAHVLKTVNTTGDIVILSDSETPAQQQQQQPVVRLSSQVATTLPDPTLLTLQALSFSAPVAALVLNGVKRVETRKHDALSKLEGQRLVIHVPCSQWHDIIGLKE
jgi:hypothetical protein